MYQSHDLRYLMDCITKRCAVPSPQTVASSFGQRHSAPSFTDIEIMPLRSRALVAYLQERGIPAQIATEHCRQVHYSCRGNRYYAVGFANESGGYELRNKYFKGCIAPKDISLRRIRDGPTNEVAVFEGFIDYLSWLTIYGRPDMDAIILNSVSNVGKAIQHLHDYGAIHCYLDNDDAGSTAMTKLSDKFDSIVIDHRNAYLGFADINDYLRAVQGLIH